MSEQRWQKSIRERREIRRLVRCVKRATYPLWQQHEPPDHMTAGEIRAFLRVAFAGGQP